MLGGSNVGQAGSCPWPTVTETVQEERNIGITLDLYSHAIPALEEAAAAKIASLFMPAEAAS